MVVLGLDKSRNNLLDVTFQIANPQVGSSDKGIAQNEPASDIITFTAADIISAKDMANTVITRKLSFAHLRTVIVGEELAKSTVFHNIIGSSIRDPEMRREINLVVSKEKATDFIHANKPKLETRPHKYYAFMQERWRDTGYVPYATLNRYFQRLGGELYLAIYATAKRNEKYKEDEDDYLAGQVPQKSGNPIQIMGSAVFKQGKMIGTLSGEETRYALYLRRKSLAYTFLASYPDPLDRKYRVSLRVIKDGNTRIDIDVEKDPPQIKVTVPVKAQIYSIPSLINYASDVEKQQLLKQSMMQGWEVKTSQLIKKRNSNSKRNLLSGMWKRGENFGHGRIMKHMIGKPNIEMQKCRFSMIWKSKVGGKNYNLLR